MICCECLIRMAEKIMINKPNHPFYRLGVDDIEAVLNENKEHFKLKEKNLTIINGNILCLTHFYEKYLKILIKKKELMDLYKNKKSV